METLITQIDAFCAEHGLSEGQFGLAAMKDKNFVPDLRAGRDIRFSTAGRVQDFMSKYAPKQAA